MPGGGVCEGPKRKRRETVELERETMYLCVAHRLLYTLKGSPSDLNAIGGRVEPEVGG